MESIDRLREYVEKAPRTSISLMARATLLGMARAIEQEVEHGWVRLPLDADGEPIHVGDVMEWTSGDTLEVIGFGGETLFYIDGSGNCEWTGTGMKRHHNAPTVEDVLTDPNSQVPNFCPNCGRRVEP